MCSVIQWIFYSPCFLQTYCFVCYLRSLGAWLFCTVLYIILINQLNRVQCCNRLLFLASIYYESEKFNASSEREQYFIVWVHPEVNNISISGFLLHGFWLCPALFLTIGYFYLHKRKNQKIYNSTLVQNM